MPRSSTQGRGRYQVTRQLIESKEINYLSESIGEFSTITPAKLAKINAGMVEVNRACQAFSKKNTQTSSQLMTLTMLNDAPYRRLRQCLAEIKKKSDALAEAYFKIKKKKAKIKGWEEEQTEFADVCIEEANYEIQSYKDTVEAGLKEIALFQSVYSDIMKSHNIPENWDELDMENDEISHHLKMIFRLCFKDVINNGKLGMGTMEYLEQYGLHAQTCYTLTADYVNSVNEMLQKKEGMPTVNSLYDWLDKMAETFKDAHKNVLKRIGITELIKDEYLYMEHNKNMS